jgi:hypothetical protein
MINWIKSNKKSLIRGAFLVPIILVMAISISHVVSWYDIANPLSWAIYLSIAIEIAAMSSIAAASVKVKGGVWLVFIIVTLVQFIGNIFFCYNEIDATSQQFKSWVELTGPIFESFGSDISDVIAQKRWLALLEGGLLPIISLASLHFFIKYGGIDDEKISTPVQEEISTPVQEVSTPVQEVSTPVQEEISVPVVTEQVSDPIEESKKSPLAINMMRKTGLR